MPCSIPSVFSQLTDDEISRLKQWACLFDIVIEEIRAEKWRFRVLYREGWITFDVPANVAPIRLSSEICSKTIRWIYYQPGKFAAKIFLAQPDQKIERLGVLYAKWKELGFPEQ